MPYAQDRSVRLYYDDGCGACQLMARAAAGLSGQRVQPVPLIDATAADLAGLSEEQRFSYAHLVRDGERWTGAAIVGPLARLTLGRFVGRFVERVPPVQSALEWTYRRLWEYRQSRGCAAARLS